MGFYNSPRIVTDNLVLNLDAGNIKSYAGDTVTPVGTDYGYIAGGMSEPGETTYSKVERIDYSNDTATAAVKGPLSAARRYQKGTGNQSYGYFGGGYPGAVSIIERIDYSSDTSTAVAKGPLGSARSSLGAVGNLSYGYWGGGNPGFVTTVERNDYSNDTATVVAKGPLDGGRGGLSATGNTSYGYFGGGSNPAHPSYPQVTSAVSRVDYSNDTATAAAKGPLTAAVRYYSATGNASYGYFVGGDKDPGVVSTTNRIDYSSDTPTLPTKGPLTAVRRGMSATGNTSYGYVAGGQVGPSPDVGLTNVERIDYSNDTPTAASKGPLATASLRMGAVSSRENGFPYAPTSATRSTSTPQGTDYGYFAGGYYPHISTIQRIDFDNDTATAAVKGPLSNSYYGSGATGNTSYGYWGGGRTSTQHTWMDRVDYSSDTSTATAKGPLSAARYRIAATGSADYGYFMGGIFPSPTAYFSAVDRLDYSSDSTAAAVKGPLTIARYYAYGTGTQSYGYCFGGQADSPTQTVSTVDRIDYSSDTPTMTAKGPLTQKRFTFGATGNASYAWCGGGRKYDGSGENFSTVDRLDYSSDTSTTSPKGPLAAVRYGVSATGNQSYGYFAGGAPSMSSLTTIDRIDYSNDTPTATAKGNLNPGSNQDHTATSSRAYALPTTSTSYPWYDTSGKGDDGNNTSGGASYGSAGGGSFTFNGTSNYVSSDDKVNLQLGAGNFTLAAWIRPGSSPAGTDYGYFASGWGPGANTTVDRLDYSSDTSTASARGPLSEDRTSAAGVGNISYGYIAGGYKSPPSPGVRTNIYRIDYSNDSPTTTEKGPLSAARKYFGAIGNTDYGWFAGGTPGPGPGYSTVDRLDYSSDTTAAAVRGPLSSNRHTGAAVGNTSYGWIGGGYQHPSPFTSLDRIDYSSDTPTAASGKGPLNYGAINLSATGSADYGWFAGGGGSPDPIYSTVSRLDYSNDTTTASPKGPLDTARYGMGATGNTSYGYFGGGYNPGDSDSTIDRIDFSSDTPTATAKGPLSVKRGRLAAASPRANALPTTAQVDSQGIISYSDTAGEENDTTCQLDVNATGKIKFTGAAGIVTSTSAPTVDTWSHAAVTRTDNTISLYINGVLENTGITTHTFSDYAKVTIGANRPRSTFYKGDISQVQIYKKALSSDEIQQNFRSVKKRFGL